MRLNSKISLRRGAYARRHFGTWHEIRSQIKENESLLEEELPVRDNEEKIPHPV